jgi:hypothetical protein
LKASLDAILKMKNSWIHGYKLFSYLSCNLQPFKVNLVKDNLRKKKAKSAKQSARPQKSQVRNIRSELKLSNMPFGPSQDVMDMRARRLPERSILCASVYNEELQFTTEQWH